MGIGILFAFGISAVINYAYYKVMKHFKNGRTIVLSFVAIVFLVASYFVGYSLMLQK
jgi:hypothetical protein